MRRIAVAAVTVLAFATGTAACSEVVNTALESAIRRTLQEVGIEAQDLSCTSEVQGTSGAGVTCSGTSGGEPVKAVATVTSESGRQAQLVVTVGGNEVVNRTVNFG